MSVRPATLWLAAVCVGAVGAGGYGVFRLGVERGMHRATAPVDSNASSASTQAGAGPAATDTLSVAQGEEATRRHIRTGIKAGDIDPANGKRVLYYHDPMAPGTRFDKPAKSPFMYMMLVPVYADGAQDAGTVTVSPRTQQNLGVRTALAVEGRVSHPIQAVGVIGFNERDQAVVQARAAGYVERLHVRATLDRVVRGQVLAELYVPDWIAVQEEFLSVREMKGSDLAPLIGAARQRMRQAGMSDAQIALVERSGRSQPRMALTAPISGVLTELVARQGMTVTTGAPLFRINGLDTVWAIADVPESQAASLRIGAAVSIHSAAAPGVRIDGRVQALLPEVDQATRTLKVRLELKNPALRLVPGMFVQMRFSDESTDNGVLVPSEAVIQTGKRVLIMLAEDNGRFHPVEVELGAESDGKTEIKRGLRAGERVVVSSQFLIDSEASLKGVEARLNAAPAADHPGGAGNP